MDLIASLDNLRDWLQFQRLVLQGMSEEYMKRVQSSASNYQ